MVCASALSVDGGVWLQVMALMFGLVYLQINDGNGNDRVQNFAGAAMMVLVSASFTTLYPVVQVTCVCVILNRGMHG